MKKAQGINVVFDKTERSTSYVFEKARAHRKGERDKFKIDWIPEPNQTVHALIAEFDESQKERHKIILVSDSLEIVDIEREYAIMNWSDDSKAKYSYPKKNRSGVPVRFLKVSVPWAA